VGAKSDLLVVVADLSGVHGLDEVLVKGSDLWGCLGNSEVKLPLVVVLACAWREDPNEETKRNLSYLD